MEILLVLVVLAVVVAVVSAPLRGHRADVTENPERAELEAAKEAKYREIRDAELDYRTGKLSEEDWRELDRQLRGEAIEILHGIDALDEKAPDPR